MAASGDRQRLILLTGATGYVGGRLLKTLETRGEHVRCLARQPARLQSQTAPTTHVVQGDVSDETSLRSALAGIEIAYYLIHSLGTGRDFEIRDRQAAERFAREARRAGVKRMIYLGGLGRGRLSPHLASRQEVGRILRESGVPTIEFRASIIIGSGSLSFEMIRALVGRLPLMTTPKWVSTLAQPIAIEDVIAYLAEALDIECMQSEVFEIGGQDRASYMGIMKEYARQRHLKRWMIPVPVLSPGLSSLWLRLITPLHARVGRLLIDSIRNSTVVEDPRALSVFRIRPMALQAAIERALSNEDREFAQTRWSDALSSAGNTRHHRSVRFGSRLVDSREASIPFPPERAFEPIQRIGGDRGWYYADWLWRLRGLIDLVIGGVGLRRGRRHPRELAPGDTLDFWRVEAFEPNRLLRLVAEMKVPGRAWLQFEVKPEPGGSRIWQTAVFDPVGLVGLVYWYGLYPVHTLVFAGMLRGIVHRVTDRESNGNGKPDSRPMADM